jgi:general secretion pathway protein D
MTEKKRFLGGGHIGILALIITFLFAGHGVLADQHTGAPEEAKFEIFSLEHISVDQGKKYLAEVVKGTVTHPFPGSPTLLVTARPGELAKARVVLDLVDEPGQFVIQPILPVSAARNIPSNEQIAARLSPSLTRGISIGSFSTPPSSDAKIKAIIDIHNDAVVAIAPPSLMEQIVAILGQKLPNDLEFHEPKKTRIPDKLSHRPERTISHVTEPTEARFLLSANGEMETEPNAVADVQEDDAVEASSAGSFQLPPLVNGEQLVNLNLADREKLTIVEFLGLVGPYLKLTFTYKEKEIDQEFTINPHGKYAGPIKVKELYPMLETVLKNAGLAMTRSSESNLVTIAPVANTLDIDPTLLDDDGIRLDRGDGMLQRVYKLEHIETSTATALLEGMKLTTDIKEVPETKTLIFTAYAYRMPRIQALLNVVDKPGEPKKFRFRPLQFTMAETLLPKLEALAEQLGTISITIADEETDTTPERPRQNPGESAAAYSVRLRQWQAKLRSQTTSRRPTTAAQQAQTTTPTVFLDADERTNRILMIGHREQLDEVEELIDTLDVAQQDLRSLELYKIQHVDAEEVKIKLEELGIITPVMTSPYASRITGDTKSPATPATTAARTPTARSAAAMRMRDEMMELPLDEPQVVVITQINSLLVNATSEQHEKIVKIKDYVDRETDEDEMPVNIYPLENQSPSHLEEVLRPLIEETIMDKEGKAVQEVRKKQEDDQIEIVADPNTFSLIVYASKRNQEWIGKLIKQLDQRRSQVLIDVTLVQISKTDAFNYDLNIISSFPNLTSTSGLTTAIMGAVNAAGAVAKDNFHPVSTLTESGRDRFIDFQSKGGAGTGFYGDEHINVLLTAMQEKNYGRVLAKPKILVNDNEEGTISTTDVTYVRTETQAVIEGVTNAVQTGFAYEPYDAGIELTIIPHISRGDFLRLDINLHRDDFGTITGEKPPDTSGSDIQTTVTVPDGSTIILGGLLKLNQSKGGTKVPILGDIPIVGGLFRSTSNSDIQRNLYVFVKAEIIRPADTDVAQAESHLQKISDRNREAFEEHEKKFQEYNDWPGLQPKTVEPIHVLDAQ